MFDLGFAMAMDQDLMMDNARYQHELVVELQRQQLDQILFDEQLERNQEALRRAQEIINQI